MTETTAPAQGPVTLRLVDASALAGRALGLRGGDTLVAVNGRGFQGDAASLHHMLSDPDKTFALTFRRGTAEFTVLAATAALGRWESLPAPLDEATRTRIDPAFLTAWEVMRAPDGSYDLFAQTLPTLGLALPLLWLMQMRLWLPSAMMVSAVAAGVIVHPALAVVVYIAGIAHLRWSHAIYLRLDRRTRGLSFHMVLAARNEAAAHAAHRALHPDDRYLFAANSKHREAATA